jgi:hypothetical protein
MKKTLLFTWALVATQAFASPVYLKCSNTDTYTLDEATGEAVITSVGRIFKETARFTANTVYMKNGFEIDRTTLVLTLVQANGDKLTQACSLMNVQLRKF